MAEKSNKFIGFLNDAKVFIGGSDAKKAKLVDWLKRHEQLETERVELDQLAEALPKEIDTLLSSGRMDDKTIEALAKKRAHLDLLPGRQEKIEDALDALSNEFEGASTLVETSVRKGIELYHGRQLAAAVAELKNLGVSEDIAERQALLREDIQAIDPCRLSFICHSYPGQEDRKARRLLWAYESLEAGFHPDSEDAQKIKKRWKIA